MSTLTLIQLVRKARQDNVRWLAIDKLGGNAYGYKQKPVPSKLEWIENGLCAHKYIGKYNLTCSWKDTLIDVTKIKVK